MSTFERLNNSKEGSFEMGEQAREVIRAWQSVQTMEQESDRLKGMQDFCLKLVTLVSPPSEDDYGFAKSQHIAQGYYKKGERLMSNDCIFVGGGTAGQRIYFKNELYVPNDPVIIERLGKNAERDNFSGQVILKTPDGRIKWMRYPEPEAGDRKFGYTYWLKFLQEFGGSDVDLEQDIP